MTVKGATSFDMERIIPDLLSTDIPLEKETLELHLARYRFAAKFVAGRSVLDMACGVGYGSALLRAGGAASVIGVDLSAQAIAYASAHYAAEGISFVHADAMTFEPGRTLDVAVSLETIEHLPDAVGFVERLVRLVGDGGTIVASVPVTLSTDVNPYHVHDFSPRQFRDFFTSRGLRVIEELHQSQPFSPLGVLKAKKGSHRNYGLRKGLPLYYARHPGMLARRLATTLANGFCNKYLVVAAQKG